MRSEVFADTGGWANFFVRSEPFHASARQLMFRWNAENVVVVTTNYVLTELVAVFTRPLRMPRALQIERIDAIRSAEWVQIVQADRVLDDEAWALLKSRPDKAWSLVDCASFIVMRRRGITEALTADCHFEQAGFVRLLK